MQGISSFMISKSPVYNTMFNQPAYISSHKKSRSSDHRNPLNLQSKLNYNLSASAHKIVLYTKATTFIGCLMMFVITIDQSGLLLPTSGARSTFTVFVNG